MGVLLLPELGQSWEGALEEWSWQLWGALAPG